MFVEIVRGRGNFLPASVINTSDTTSLNPPLTTYQPSSTLINLLPFLQITKNSESPKVDEGW